VKEFSLWEGELEFTERACVEVVAFCRLLCDMFGVAGLISQDVRNNSAWNHRWLAVSALSGVRFVCLFACSVVFCEAQEFGCCQP
jgi:hypothetical protein